MTGKDGGFLLLTFYGLVILLLKLLVLLVKHFNLLLLRNTVNPLYLLLLLVLHSIDVVHDHLLLRSCVSDHFL